MNSFLKGLFVDLIQRIKIVIDDLQNSKHHDDIRERFIDSTIKQFEVLSRILQETIDLGLLEIDGMVINIIPKFKILQRRFKNLHSYRYLPIKSYSAPEAFFFKIITKIYAEHRITALPPIVSTISNHDHYYWAVPGFEIIALPSGEEHSLLNLPDLYHEIGHLLYDMYQAESSVSSKKEVEIYFSKNKHLWKNIDFIKTKWLEYWLEEFSCDLIGCYMSGPAYAWTNLKLLITEHNSDKIYKYYPRHPANEARMRIIILMLKKLNLHSEKDKIEKKWSHFLKKTEGFKPDGYDFIFPQRLLTIIVDEFYTFHQNADIASYPELTRQTSIAEVLNEAWSQAIKKPTKFNSYQERTIAKLKSEFGLLN